MIPLFASPLAQVELDLDLEKLTEFAFQMQNKDKKGVQRSNIGGWQSNDIREEKHEEFIRLKKEIDQYLQIYHSEVFGSMVFKKNIIHNPTNMWVNINEKHHNNEWHIHPWATLSGTFYIKHDGSREHGSIIFKNPNGSYFAYSHWPPGLIEKPNELTSELVDITPKSNMLLIFPSWVDHKVENNSKDVTRISLSFNAAPL
tara:strand:+ start:75 stop:677 length:603 start_codon:yes stop_codon:yes gene_type:complete